MMTSPCRQRKICLGLSGGLSGTVLSVLIAIYIIWGRTASSDPPRNYISAVVATNDSTYFTSVGLAIVTSAILIAIEVGHHIRLYRASITTVVLFSISLLITICVTYKRQKMVHWVFTGSMLVWIVVTSALWTHSAWLNRSSLRVPMVVLTVLTAVAGLGAAVVASKPPSPTGVWLTVCEWFCVVLFLILLLCSCAGSRRGCSEEGGQ